MKTNFEKKKKIFGFISILIFVFFMLFVGWFIGRPMLKLFAEPDVFRDWISSKGWWGRLVFIGMVAIQVIFAIIPGEPLEIGAGYAFGAIEGTLLCLIGFLAGSTVIYLFIKKWGIKFVELFCNIDKINNLKFLNTNNKLNVLAYILFLIPGTPKDIMIYFLALTKISAPAFFIIVTVARIPSVITSTIGGNAIGTKNYVFAVIVFAVTVIISIGGYLLFSLISKRHSKKS